MLGGFALRRWHRPGATGALLIAIGGGLRVLHEALGVYNLWRMFNRGPGDGSYVRWMTIVGVVHSAGSLVAAVPFIGGVALVLRRLPAASR